MSVIVVVGTSAWELTLYADYAVVIIMGVFIFASASWVMSAHKWFHGPINNVDTSRTASLDDSEKL